MHWVFPAGEAVTNLWNGAYSTSGQAVTVTSESYNGALGAGAATAFGLTASASGTGTAPGSVTCTAS